jgi:hypothetical protein
MRQPSTVELVAASGLAAALVWGIAAAGSWWTAGAPGHAQSPEVAEVQPRATTQPTEKWLDAFPAHPRAQFVCRQHVVGAGPRAPHIEWSLYATTDTPETVVAFYASALGVKAEPGTTTLTFSGPDGRRKLSMQPVSDQRPDCGTEPAAQAKTVLVASLLIEFP